MIYRLKLERSPFSNVIHGINIRYLAFEIISMYGLLLVKGTRDKENKTKKQTQ